MSTVGDYWKRKVSEEYIQKPEDTITTQVMEDLKSRADRGLKKYNTTLAGNNKDDFMQHAYEEALDLAQYLKKEMSIIPLLQELIYDNPNDQKLGEIIRKKFGKK